MREDPDRMFFVAGNRPNLVRLKLRNRECSYFSIIEPTTKVGCPFEPAIDGIPGDLLYPGDRRFVQALDAECGNIVEGCATVLESMVRRSCVRAECLPASSAPVSTALP
jgi:hypothetical protein